MKTLAAVAALKFAAAGVVPKEDNFGAAALGAAGVVANKEVFFGAASVAPRELVLLFRLDAGGAEPDSAGFANREAVVEPAPNLANLVAPAGATDAVAGTEVGGAVDVAGDLVGNGAILGKPEDCTAAFPGSEPGAEPKGDVVARVTAEVGAAVSVLGSVGFAPNKGILGAVALGADAVDSDGVEALGLAPKLPLNEKAGLSFASLLPAKLKALLAASATL